MSAYIDRQFIFTMIGEPKANALLSSGGTPSGSYGARLDQLISGSSSMVDNHAKAREYLVPFENPEASIMDAVAGDVIRRLYQTSGQPIPENLQADVNDTDAFLNLLRRGEIELVNASVDTSPSGLGHKFSTPKSGSVGLFSINSQWGTYF